MTSTAPQNGSLNPQLNDRTIRVFISSTFRDMKLERELLVKEVFPDLRSICARRFVTFTEIDLRWGINEEQSAEGQVLPICLEEIHLSRPYFIGMLGERYGWIPNTVPPEILAKEPWLQEHIGNRTSVTELEILHGVLNNPLMADHTFFYFRDPKYLDGLTDKECEEMTERDIPEDVLKFGRDGAANLTKERKAKLASLKQRISKSGLPLVDNYPDPKALANSVHEHFIKLIDELYPEKDTPDLLDQEKQGHEVYARKKLLAYVSRPIQTGVLDAFADSEPTGKGLVITGESGSGKTTLLADWTRNRQKKHPNEFCFQHYFGATPQSAAIHGFLRRLLGELRRFANIPDELPSTKEKMIELLPQWLAQTAGKYKLILVLDALNQIEGDEPDKRLAWLPMYFLSNVRVIASALPSKALDTLRERGWQEHKLPLANEAERDEMITAFFNQYRKTPRPDIQRQVASAIGSANPLFLRTVLEELRQFGSFDQLPAEVDHYLEAKSPEGLFRLVLQRWQRDFDAGSDLVRRTLCHLWAARQGLAETELIELLGTETVSLPRQVLRPLFLAMEPHLTQRSGLFSFGHDFLRSATELEFLKAESNCRSAHILLADYFEKQIQSPHKLMELPWQLEKACEWRRLYELLTNLEFFKDLWELNSYELKSSWIKIERFSSYRLIEGYHHHIKHLNSNNDSVILHHLGSLFIDTGHVQDSLEIFRALEEYHRRKNNLYALGEILGRLGFIYKNLGEINKSIEIFDEQVDIASTLGDNDSLSMAYGDLAWLEQSLGNLDKATDLHKKAENLYRLLKNYKGLYSSLEGQALILVIHGNYDQALILHQETEKYCRTAGDLEGLRVSLGNQAGLFFRLKQYDIGMKVTIEAENICRELGDLDGLQRTLGNKANILSKQGYLSEAMALNKEAERICRSLGNIASLQYELGNQAIILTKWGRYDEAMDLFKEEESICRNLGFLNDLQRSLGNQAEIFILRRNLDKAMQLLKEKEGICRKLNNPDSLQRALEAQITILSSKNDYKSVLPLIVEREQILRQLKKSEDLFNLLTIKAIIFGATGKVEEAFAIYKENEQIARQLGNLKGVADTLNGQGLLLQAKSELANAITFHLNAEKIYQQLNQVTGVALSQSLRALALDKMGRVQEAVSLAQMAYRLITEEHGEDAGSGIKNILNLVSSHL